MERARQRGYRPRFMTLTVPAQLGIAADIGVAPRVWASVRRELQRRYGRLDYVRVVEWTPGAGAGNSHLHVLIFSPYIGREWLAHIWGRALEREGYRVPRIGRATIEAMVSSGRARYMRDELPDIVCSPMVDVRIADPATISAELAKYLVKDWLDGERDGQRIEPELYAEAYGALLGRRCIQTSRGYWVEAERICPDCGELHPCLVFIETAAAPAPAAVSSSADRPRGPPLRRTELSDSL